MAAPLRLAQLWAQVRVAEKQRGAVVNVSSQSSTRVFPAHTSYSVSSWAAEFAGFRGLGFRVQGSGFRVVYFVAPYSGTSAPLNQVICIMPAAGLKGSMYLYGIYLGPKATI